MFGFNNYALMVAIAGVSYLVISMFLEKYKRRRLRQNGFVPLDVLLGANGIEKELFWKTARDLDIHPRVRKLREVWWIEDSKATDVLKSISSMKTDLSKTLSSDRMIAAVSAVAGLAAAVKPDNVKGDAGVMYHNDEHACYVAQPGDTFGNLLEYFRSEKPNTLITVRRLERLIKESLRHPVGRVLMFLLPAQYVNVKRFPELSEFRTPSYFRLLARAVKGQPMQAKVWIKLIEPMSNGSLEDFIEKWLESNPNLLPAMSRFYEEHGDDLILTRDQMLVLRKLTE
jgi:hypothetical protein